MHRKTLAGIALALGLAAVQPRRPEGHADHRRAGLLQPAHRRAAAEDLPGDAGDHRAGRPGLDRQHLRGRRARTVTAENQGKFTESWDGLDENSCRCRRGVTGSRASTCWLGVEDHRRAPLADPQTGDRRGDSWYPMRDQDDKYPWFGPAAEGRTLWGDICVAPADSGHPASPRSSTPTSSAARTLSCSTSTSRSATTKFSPATARRRGRRLGHRHRRRAGLVSVRQRRHPLPLPRHMKPFGEGRPTTAAMSMCRVANHRIAAWRDPATGKRYVYLAQETRLEPADLPWQCRDGKIATIGCTAGMEGHQGNNW